MIIERITFEIELEDKAHLDELVQYIKNVGAKNVKVEPVVKTTMPKLDTKAFSERIDEFSSRMAKKKPPEDTA